jgi:hypothetical protein
MKKLIIQCLKMQSAGLVTIQNYLKQNGYNATINRVQSEANNLVAAGNATLNAGVYEFNN